MMVAPLNAWGGKDRQMIGLLYITSSHGGTFTEDHVDYMRFAADTVASTMTRVVDYLMSSGPEEE